MKDTVMKNKIICILIYLFIGVIFSVTKLRYTSLIYVLFFGVAIFFCDNIIKTKNTNFLFVFTAFCATLMWDPLYRIFLVYHDLSDLIKVSLAAMIFILCVLFAIGGKLMYTLPAPILLGFLDPYIAVLCTAMLFGFSLTSMRINKKGKTNLFLAIFNFVCLMVLIFIILPEGKLPEAVMNFVRFSSDLINIFAMIIAVIIAIILTVKCKFSYTMELIISLIVTALAGAFLIIRSGYSTLPLCLVCMCAQFVFLIFNENIKNNSLKQTVFSFCERYKYLCIIIALFMLKT